MESRLNMSLDDLINMNKSTTSTVVRRGGGGGATARGRGRSGPFRRLSDRAPYRTTPYTPYPPMGPDSYWQHDLYAIHGGAGASSGGGGFGGGGSSIETGTKLYISNLDYGVSNDDIKELFAEVGDLKRYGINYDKSGRSKGTAEVVFSRKGDALAAVKRYNNIELDGKPMKVEIVSAPTAAPPAINGTFRESLGVGRSFRGRSGPIRRPQGGRGFGRGRGRGGDRDEKVSAEQLDAELDKYHTEAMKTN